MAGTNFHSRLVFDKSFYEYSKTVKTSPRIPIMLMKINTEARPNKRTHNVMSNKIFMTILNENTSISWDLLRHWYYPMAISEYEIIEDEIERNIKLAIEMAEEEPEKTIIITGSEEVKKLYESNPHFKDVPTISVICCDEAVKLINWFFRICTEK